MKSQFSSKQKAFDKPRGWPLTVLGMAAVEVAVVVGVGQAAGSGEIVGSLTEDAPPVLEAAVREHLLKISIGMPAEVGPVPRPIHDSTVRDPAEGVISYEE